VTKNSLHPSSNTPDSNFDSIFYLKVNIEVLRSVYSGEPVESFDFSSLEVVRNEWVAANDLTAHRNRR
jgi:hypothetical protein